MTLALVALATPIVAQPAPRLFEQPPMPRAIALDTSAWAEYDVRVARRALPTAGRLTLDLPDGRSLSVRRTGFEARSARDYSWRGKIQLDTGEGDLILAVKGDAVAGAIFGLEATYEIVPAPDGLQRLVKVDDSTFATGADPLVPPTGSASRSFDRQADVSGGDSEGRLDLMVLYTENAADAAGGPSAVEAQIQVAVDQMNTAYSNSGITTRVSLAHTGQVSYTEAGSPYYGSDDLDWLIGDAAVARLRDAYAADQVSLVVEYSSSVFCGVGYVQRSPGPSFAPYAFQVSGRQCMVSQLTLAHEFGHNQGMEHNPENSNAYPSGASYPFAYAHYVDGSYRTVMSYASPCTSGCTRVPQFSNSTVSYLGQPTGILDQRENYRTLNNTDVYIARFRRRGLLPDLSGDNMADILWRHGSTGTLYAWHLDGLTLDGGAVLGQLADSDWQIAGVRDFDNDGNGDILWQHLPSGTVYVWTMKEGVKIGGAFLGQVSDANWQIAGTGDFNGDREPDILWHHGPTGTVYVWTMSGTTQTGGALVGQASTDWEIAGVGDFNDDGAVDILWFHPATGSVYVWTMSGTSQAGGAWIGQLADTSWKIVGVADFNGDKHADIVWLHEPTGTVHVWAMDGTTVSGGQTVGSASSGWAVVAPQ
jgi:hypothetical protein